MSPIDAQAAEWVARLNTGIADPDVQAAFQAWYDADSRHRGAFLRAEAAWTLLDRAQVLTHGAAPAEDVLSQPLLAPPATVSMSARPIPRLPVARPTRRLLLTGGMVASVAVAVGVGYALKSRLSFATQRGELRKVPLADRSMAAINTDSQIDVAMTDHLRHVQLVKGEAWFEVAKNPDAPFVVSAGDIRVRAVGTAFSVRRRTHGADVLVTEGVVETWSTRDPGKRTTLKAGNEAFVADKVETVDVDFQPDEVTRKLAWREREIILREESLATAVAEFNRYNDQQIVIADPALGEMKLVGGFAVDQPETFARAVHAALNAPVSIREDRIIIGTAGKAG